MLQKTDRQTDRHTHMPLVDDKSPVGGCLWWAINVCKSSVGGCLGWAINRPPEGPLGNDFKQKHAFSQCGGQDRGPGGGRGTIYSLAIDFDDESMLSFSSSSYIGFFLL